MLVYPVVFLIFFFLASLNEHNVISIKNNNKKYYFIFYIVFFSIYVGLRLEVGGDWGNYYQNYFIRYKDLSFAEYLETLFHNKDILFISANFFIPKIFDNYIFLNFILSIFFSYSLIYFAFKQKRPLFVILIAIPYYINVIGMGYHRQSLAISIFLFGLIYLEQKKTNKFLISIFFAYLFHFTSLILLPLAILSKKKIYFKYLIIVTIFLLIIFIININLFLIIIKNYISISYASSGAMIRCFMNFVPAILYLYFSNHKNLQFNNNKLIKFLAISSILFFLAVPFSISTAMIDRIALYLIPFQMIFWSRFIDIFSKDNKSNLIVFYSISIAYYMALLIWAYHGTFSLWWFPYDNLIFKFLR